MDSVQLIPDGGGPAIPIDSDLVLIGRDAICDIQLSDVSVSRQHAEIRRDGDRWTVRDLNSANGVLIDGVQIPRSMLLNGQRLHFGKVGFRVEIVRALTGDGATLVMDRPMAGRPSPPGSKNPSPRSPMIKTVQARAVAAPPVRATPPPPRRFEGAGLLIAAIVVLGVGVALLRSRPAPVHPRPKAPAPSATVAPVETPPQSSPEPTSASSPPGTIAVSTDTGAGVLVDGERRATLPAGGRFRVDVTPGEHIVTFEVGKERHDVVVRINGSEQATARFEAHLYPSPSPAATAPPRRVVSVPVSTPLPTRPSAAPTPPPARAPAPPTDTGLTKGAAAVARADFYRAVLLLKDAADRLEKDPQEAKQAVWAHAYLAWAYQGLNRPADAQAEAQRALQTDPGIAAAVDAFPPQVAVLFKRAR